MSCGLCGGLMLSQTRWVCGVCGGWGGGGEGGFEGRIWQGCVEIHSLTTLPAPLPPPPLCPTITTPVTRCHRYHCYHRCRTRFTPRCPTTQSSACRAPPSSRCSCACWRRRCGARHCRRSPAAAPAAQCRCACCARGGASMVGKLPPMPCLTPTLPKLLHLPPTCVQHAAGLVLRL